ncbi:unnamed protein product [Periconia digitata]|uniref:DUF3752 domain-containing protein n=1 Tax=Periconia digitata TaxID=1303443 RepID=A0A9W4U6M0_9PLEO|nr:unnamed protein product [Periconia digitata]
MPIGPSLPPHLSKRSREDDDHDANGFSSDGGEKRRKVIGPAAPPPSKPSPPRVLGPSLPPQSASRSSSPDSDVGPAPPPASSKPTRVLGPAPPPAPLDQRPPNPPSDHDDSDSSSDDDFGPAPPPVGATYDTYGGSSAAKSAFDTEPQYTDAPKKVQRDDWMTMPPTHDGLSRIDPTKMRARKFNTGKNAGAGSGGDGMGIWTETPEQKLKRLQDEAMGITAPANTSSSKKESKRTREEDELNRKRREQIEASRGKSLVDQHKDKSVKSKEPEDDPSKRGFDYEKDMAVTGNLSHKQKRELMNKAKGFGDRFSGGNFL